MTIKSRNKYKRLYKKKSNRTRRIKRTRSSRYKKTNKNKNKNKLKAKKSRRYKNYNKNKNKNKQKGGFYFGTATNDNQERLEDIHMTLENYFKYIFNNNIITIEPLGNEGAFGSIFVLKFNDNYLRSIKGSDFAIRDYNSRPCKRMLIKLSYINPTLRGSDETNIGDKLAVSTDAFNYEIHIQRHVFKKTNSHLQPITPLIYYQSIHDSEKTNYYLDLIYQNSSQAGRVKIQNIQQIFTQYPGLNLGMIIMEMRDGYVTVEDLEKQNPAIINSLDFLAMTGEVLNRLHHICQVTHGDFHKGNILINTTEAGYYTPLLGNILIIDWGRSKIHDDGIIGTQSNPIPINEAEIELKLNTDWWSYRWLNLPYIYQDGPGGPGGSYGHQWNAPGVNEGAINFRNLRPNNYTTNSDRIPGYFYQPDNLKCQYKPVAWEKVCDKE